MMGGQSFAQEEKKGKYVIVIANSANDQYDWRGKMILFRKKKTLTGLSRTCG